MKSLPSLPWWKVRHQPIGDRIIKLTNRCVWVIDVSNPLGGPQGKCQLINNTSLWTGSVLLQSKSLLLPRGAKSCPTRPLSAYYNVEGWKATALNISATLKSTNLCRWWTSSAEQRMSTFPLYMSEIFMSLKQVKRKTFSSWIQGQTPRVTAQYMGHYRYRNHMLRRATTSRFKGKI